MADVRCVSKNIFLIAVVVYILNQLRHLALSEYPLGVALSWLVWGILLLCLGFAAYLALAALMKIYCAVFSLKHERTAIEKALLYWGAVAVCGLVVRNRFYWIFERIEDFIYERFPGIFGFYAGDTAVEWLAELYYLRLYIRVFYLAVFVIFAVKLLLNAFQHDVTIGKIIKSILMPILFICIALALGYINHEQLTMYRAWLGLILLAIVGLHLLVNKIAYYINVSELVSKRGLGVYAAFRGFTGTDYNHIIDSGVIYIAYAITVMTQLLAVVSLVVYVITSHQLIINI
ncbi:MAG: hypothetical protein FWE42_01475 [Defluviitaleaceae bacterium]|nr:hypothetical protein [Defluviitaleaceae bacterium]